MSARSVLIGATLAAVRELGDELTSLRFLPNALPFFFLPPIGALILTGFFLPPRNEAKHVFLDVK